MRSACAVLCCIYRLSVSTTFFHIISQTARFPRRKLPNVKCVVWFSVQLLSENSSLWAELSEILLKNIYIGLHVKYSLFVSYCIETRIFPIDFRKILKCQITRHVTPSCGSRDVTWGQTDGQMDRYDETVAFPKFTNAPKNIKFSLSTSLRNIGGVKV